MVSERYKIAMAETLHYLKGIEKEDINKIPNEFMDFLENNADQNYKCEFDYTKPLNELNLKNETRGLIAMICLNYWCVTEEQKNKFREHLIENERTYQEELNKKYNIDDIFKNNESISKTEINENINRLPIKVEKESILKRIFNQIKKFFNINK